jgi:predicted ribosome quality control (RQC) complex YloA/Tae2 family protein
LTHFSRETAATPSPFVARLRKFLKTRRVTGLRQVGTDRIIEFQFSEGQFLLYLEFYAGGNIILTDGEMTILAIWRNVAEGSDQEELKLGLKYSLANRQNVDGVPPLSKERVVVALQKAVNKRHGAVEGNKRSKKEKEGIRKALAVSLTEFPPMLLEHALWETGFDTNLTVEEILGSDELIDKVLVALKKAEGITAEIISTEVSPGYIIAKITKSNTEKIEAEVAEASAASATKLLDGKSAARSESGDMTEGEIILYDDFHPFRPRQFENRTDVRIIKLEGYNNTVDEFFSSLEGQKLESKLREREENAKKRIELARSDHQKRLEGLQDVQQMNVRKAQAIEANLEEVEEATEAINGLIGQGMDWVEIGRFVEMEQSRGNPVAEMIKLPLKLFENTATLLLGEMEDVDKATEYDVSSTDSETDEEDQEDDGAQDTRYSSSKSKRQADTRLAIDVDLSLSPWANSRQYYQNKRVAAVKEQKTIQSSEQALKNTERKIQGDLKKGLKQEKAILRPTRKQFWFEKFIFFISSDGYLVLGGKDAPQDETLYRRYLKKGDVYVHADLQGAASVIIKNKIGTPHAPIPPSTLSQAGNMSVSTSKAWDSKAVMSAWWVNAEQVSKTTAEGDYLNSSGFVIKGEKHFLPPAQLILGFGVMFQISEESKARHVKHRVDSKEIVDPQGESIDNIPIGELDIEDSDIDDLEESDDEAVSSNLPIVTEVKTESDLETHAEGDKEVERDGAAAQPLEIRSSNQDEQLPMERSGGIRAEGEEDAISETETDSRQHSEGIREPGKAPPNTPSSGKLGPSSERQTNAPLPRGKRGKKKKVASKYADQDEEDRETSMKLLGSVNAKAKLDLEAEARRAKEEAIAFHREKRRKQVEKAAAEGKAAEEKRRIMLNEGIEEDGEEGDLLVQLDAFVGMPLPGDEILEAFPVCAPWTAMAKIKYKAKLQPGTTKKGKAVKEILSAWLYEGERRKIDYTSEDKERMWPREQELIKGWKDTEVINTVPVSKVKILMGATPGKGGAAKTKSSGSKKQRGQKKK